MPRLATADETRRFGHALGVAAAPGGVIALSGELGAGKTELVKGIASGLGLDAEVTSPTFTLVHEYGGDPPLFHFDFYRIDDPEEILAIGWDEYLEAGGICVVEWAEKFPELIPPHADWWRIAWDAGRGRTIERIVRR